MLKRLLLILAFAGLLSPAYAAGTIPGFSLAQQQDSDGTPLVGCKLYTIQAGTTSTPQNAYQDSALTIALTNPVLCDAYGRLPQIFLADGSIKLRLTKSNGVQVFAADGILVVGASSGGGGGSPVDATTVFATGDIKSRHGTGVLSGFVRLNGRTIGSATSGATERANADTQALFEYLYDADTNLAVSGGRGASAAADWAANKTIALPDGRGRVLAGLVGMGASNSSLWDLVTFTTGGGTTLGATAGVTVFTLSQIQLPSVNFTVTGTASVYSTFAGVPWGMSTAGTIDAGSGAANGVYYAGSLNIGSLASTGTITGTAASGGSGSRVESASPVLFITNYIKL